MTVIAWMCATCTWCLVAERKSSEQTVKMKKKENSNTKAAVSQTGRRLTVSLLDYRGGWRRWCVQGIGGMMRVLQSHWFRRDSPGQKRWMWGSWIKQTHQLTNTWTKGERKADKNIVIDDHCPEYGHAFNKWYLNCSPGIALFSSVSVLSWVVSFSTVLSEQMSSIINNHR